MRRTVTFTSDFGYQDSYVAEVRGVIEACAPRAHVVDLTHGISPGDIKACSFVLSSACRYFEDGTVHLAVVDPGVGTKRGNVAVEAGEYTFIGPDNGILYEAASQSGIRRIVAVSVEKLFSEAEKLFSSKVFRRIVRNGPSSTFHGRDVFAPLAAYIVSGAPVDAVGAVTDLMEKVRTDVPDVREDRIIGAVIYADRFGNLITNVENGLVGPGDEVFCSTGGRLESVGRIKMAYAAAEEGKCLPVTGSRGYMEIAVNGGSAKERLGASTGDEILVLRG